MNVSCELNIDVEMFSEVLDIYILVFKTEMRLKFGIGYLCYTQSKY